MKSFLLLPSLLASACEPSVTIAGDVTVALHPAPRPTLPASVMVVVDERETVAPDWSPIGRYGLKYATFDPAVAVYHYEWDTPGSAMFATYVAAFIDLDADGKLGAGEPFGAFAKNPFGDDISSTDADPNVADIAIDMRAP